MWNLSIEATLGNEILEGWPYLIGVDCTNKGAHLSLLERVYLCQGRRSSTVSHDVKTGSGKGRDWRGKGRDWRGKGRDWRGKGEGLEGEKGRHRYRYHVACNHCRSPL